MVCQLNIPFSLKAVKTYKFVRIENQGHLLRLTFDLAEILSFRL